MKKNRGRTPRQRRRKDPIQSASPRRREAQCRASRQKWQDYKIALFLGMMIVGGIATFFLRALPKTTRLVADPDDVKQVAIGQGIYLRSCASCHGGNLAGQPHGKQPLSTGSFPAPSLDATGHTWQYTDAWLFTTTKYGGHASAARDFPRPMPAFNDRLTDTEIWAVLAYIKSRWPAAVRAKHARRTLHNSKGRHQHSP